MQIQKLNKRRYLGPLCKHGHRYVYESTNSSTRRKTNKSVRYKSCNACCVCSAISVEKRKKQQKKYRDTHKKKMQKYQKSYHKAHGKNYRSDYHRNYYLKVIKPKRKRERHNKKLLQSIIYPSGIRQAGKLSEVFDGLGITTEITNKVMKAAGSINKETAIKEN